MRILVVTNIPSPYRVLLFNKLNEKYGENILVYYCAVIESNRSWNIENLEHNYYVSKKSLLHSLYLNFDIVKIIRSFKPVVIITAGFNPTMLLAWFYTLFTKCKHVVFTDSWILTVSRLRNLHRLVRKAVFRTSAAFICIGKKGKEYLKQFGVEENRIFISPIAIDNDHFKRFMNGEKKYDIMFSGQFTERKMPHFFVNIALQLSLKKKIRILMIGSGSLKDDILDELKASQLEFEYPGYIQQKDLPLYYASSKLLLFPTKEDPWGVVANEACAAGTPVLTCDNSGAANDLVIDGYNGFVLPLDEKLWAEKISVLLENQELYDIFSINCLKHIKKYSLQNSAVGFERAIKFCAKA